MSKEITNFFIQADFGSYELKLMKYMAAQAQEYPEGIFHYHFNQCTHISCDRGLGLHDCPDSWQRQRAKTERFAFMYGGKFAK